MRTRENTYRKRETHSHKQSCKTAARRAASFRAAMRIDQFSDKSSGHQSAI